MKLMDLPSSKIKPGLKVRIGSWRGLIEKVMRHNSVVIRWITNGFSDVSIREEYYINAWNALEEDLSNKIQRLKCLANK
jgi:hypothetical protein